MESLSSYTRVRSYELVMGSSSTELGLTFVSPISAQIGLLSIKTISFNLKGIYANDAPRRLTSIRVPAVALYFRLLTLPSTR